MRKTNKISRFLPGSLLKKMRDRQSDSEKLAVIWHKLVGQDEAKHSTPASYHNEVLTVLADNAIWASKLRHNLPVILEECRKQGNLGSIKKIKIKIGHRETNKRSRLTPVPKTTRISKSSAAVILESAEHIKDETLRASMERLGSNVRDYKK